MALNLPLIDNLGNLFLAQNESVLLNEKNIEVTLSTHIQLHNPEANASYPAPPPLFPSNAANNLPDTMPTNPNPSNNADSFFSSTFNTLTSFFSSNNNNNNNNDANGNVTNGEAANLRKVIHRCDGARLILTNQRILVINPANVPPQSQHVIRSLAIPLPYLREMDLEQPFFGANRIKAVVIPFPGGGLHGKSPVEFIFKEGGAYDFYERMNHVTKVLMSSDLAHRHYANPPPLYAAPPSQNLPSQPPNATPYQTQSNPNPYQPQGQPNLDPPPYNPYQH